MKTIHKELSYREIEFLIKQEVVYLEKEIIDAKEKNKDFYLSFVTKKNWDVQISENTFSDMVLENMLYERENIKQMYEGYTGTISVRFFDINTLSLLFIGCDEYIANEFCNHLNSNMLCSQPTKFDFEYIGDSVYKVAYQFKKVPSSKKRQVDVGLSYQQNYLVHVVSRDRNEPIETLLSEAVNQAIFKYHQVIRNE